MKREGNRKPVTARRSNEERQRRFVDAYVANGGNATAAAVAAGYKPGEAAKKAGHRMSTNVHVAAELKRRASDLAERSELKLEALGDVLRAIVHARAVDALTAKQRAQLGTLTPELEIAIVGFKFDPKGNLREVRLADKVGAIERVLRLHAMTARIGPLEGTPSEQARTVAARVASGELTLEQGMAFMNMIAGQVRIVEADEHDRRLRVVEEALAKVAAHG